LQVEFEGKNMAKHKSVAISTGDLISAIEGSTDTPWTDVVEHNCTCGEDCTCADTLGGMWWRVVWPEHVSYPRFNSDATYFGPMPKSEAIDRADKVYGE
jgi:hypothetical protein